TRHGALPGVPVADMVLEGVTCIRLDASVVPAHSDKELAEPNFKGFGHHPLLAYCDNTGEPLAGMLRKGSAGSNTTADHLEAWAAAIAARPPSVRRRLMVTSDGAGASRGGARIWQPSSNQAGRGLDSCGEGLRAGCLAARRVRPRRRPAPGW